MREGEGRQGPKWVDRQFILKCVDCNPYLAILVSVSDVMSGRRPRCRTCRLPLVTEEQFKGMRASATGGEYRPKNQEPLQDFGENINVQYISGGE